MSFINLTLINFKKLKTQAKKGLFLIIPLTILVSLSIIISSQSANLYSATNQVVFSAIQDKATVLKVTREQSETPSQPGMGSSRQQPFNEGDLSVIQNINHIENAQIISSLPVNRSVTSDLFADVDLQLSSLAPISPEMASLHTDEGFSFDFNQPIPVILNASTFIEDYQDWQGQDEFVLNFRELREQGLDQDEIRNSSPIKSRAIEYSAEELLGKTFSVNIGGLPEILDYESVNERGTIMYRKLNAEEVAEIEQNRAEEIGLFWDYQALKSGQQYTFKVVGVVQDSMDRNTYIPLEAGNQIMQDYFNQQIAARNQQQMPVEYLDLAFVGMEYDGSTLASSQSGGRGMSSMINTQNISQTKQNSGSSAGGTHDEEQTVLSGISHQIPGLVVQKDQETGTLVEHQDPDIYQEAIKTGNQILLKVDSFENREGVIAEINQAGFAYQDFSNLEVITDLNTTLERLSQATFIGFIVLTAGVVMLTMSKFVSDSKKEIGIYRAIGATKNQVGIMFIIQTLIYVAISLGIGIMLGLGLNLLVSDMVKNWFQENIISHLNQTYNINQIAESSLFVNVDWQSVGVFSLLLVIVALVFALYPALKASKISPVEAIKEG